MNENIMDENIMENDEVSYVEEDVTCENSKTGWKIAGTVLAAIGVIYGGLKLRKKIKAKKKEEETVMVAASDSNVVEINNVDSDGDVEEKRTKRKSN